MKIENGKLIEELLAIVQQAVAQIKDFEKLSPEQLNQKPHADGWSILECIEHLNLYGDFYLPAIEKSILSQKTHKRTLIFKSGILGNYFAKQMQPQEGIIKNKMKTFNDKNPSKLQSELSELTLNRFLKQLEHLQSFLNKARQVDLTKAKTPISITKFLTFRLGDTFRFFIFHIQRHLLQASRV
jgi:hypothetical protein